MSEKKIILSFFTALILISGLSAQNFSKVENSPQPFGLNMAGGDFGKIPGVYNKDYAYPTTTDLDYVKSKGFRLIRLPFKWERIQHQLYGELDKEEIKRLRYVVDEAAKRDIQVLFDPHNYARRQLNEKQYRIGEGGLEIEHLADLWGKIAKEFSEYKNIWGYGLMNEPHDMLEKTPWTKIAQASILAIRNYDAKTAIVVGGDSWSSAERWMQYSDNLKNLYDPADNLIFEAHVYFDEDASGTYKKSYEEEKANPYKGIERVQPFIKWLRDNNFRGFIGEYGIPDKDERWQVCLDNFMTYLQDNGINGTYWAAGPLWGNYPLSVQPTNNYTTDRPQMKVLEKYLWTK